MNPHGKTRIITAFAVGIFIFLMAIMLPKFFISNPIAKIATTQTLELTLALLAILIFGKGRFAEYGFCLPKLDSPLPATLMRWAIIGILALLLGALATAAILITGAVGNPIVKQLTFPQIILFVWLFSSAIEEIFTRGFLQGHLAKAIDSSKFIPFLRVDVPTFLSALFFACMHLSLIQSGADLKTVIIILIFTFSLGLLAGHLRSKTGSLLPAIGVHILANIGGVIGGIVYGIISIINGGHFPVR